MVRKPPKINYKTRRNYLSKNCFICYSIFLAVPPQKRFCPACIDRLKKEQKERLDNQCLRKWDNIEFLRKKAIEHQVRIMTNREIKSFLEDKGKLGL
jgi:hypothetical protein